jgi:4-hydroxy-tetrahydrodipicolinate synthase
MPRFDSPRFSGSFVALITPFKKGKVDERAFQDFVEWQIKMGTHGLVPCGTTGESPTLTHEEHKRVVELCIEAANGRVPVMAGTGSNSTAEAMALTHHARQAGADAALVVTPYYNKPNQAGLYAHYAALSTCRLPIFIYNIPGRCVIDMSVETMSALSKLPNIVGCKDATGDLTRPAKTRIACGPNFVQLDGDDGTALGFSASGGVGCISVTGNIAPGHVAKFQEALLAGDYATASEMNDKLMPLHQALFVETSPGPVKYAASLMGICEADVRLPLVPVSAATRQTVENALRPLGLIGRANKRRK